MASGVYDSATRDIPAGTIALGTDTLYVMLVTSSYTPNYKTHAKRSDVTNEVTGTGYTAGGKVLSGVTATLSTVDDQTVYTCTDPVWTTATITARGAVVYKHRGGASSADELVSYIDFGSDVTATGVDFTITSFGTSGFLSLDA
jgi:hypothetical protein